MPLWARFAQRIAMKTKHVFERVSQKASYDLPASLNREIGRVIVRWAHFESHMQAMIYAIVFDGAADKAALGRLAIRELKVGERADLLGQVADVQGVMLDTLTFHFCPTCGSTVYWVARAHFVVRRLETPHRPCTADG
jgi:hypothetical protein